MELTVSMPVSKSYQVYQNTEKWLELRWRFTFFILLPSFFFILYFSVILPGVLII